MSHSPLDIWLQQVPNYLLYSCLCSDVLYHPGWAKGPTWETSDYCIASPFFSGKCWRISSVSDKLISTWDITHLKVNEKYKEGKCEREHLRYWNQNYFFRKKNTGFSEMQAARAPDISLVDGEPADLTEMPSSPGGLRCTADHHWAWVDPSDLTKRSLTLAHPVRKWTYSWMRNWRDTFLWRCSHHFYLGNSYSEFQK